MTSQNTPSAGKDAGKLVGLVLGLAAIASIMLLALGLPAVNSGASDLPLAVSGPAPAVEALTGTFEETNPGTFEVTTHTTDAAVRDAILNREAIGGIAIGAPGATGAPEITIYTASGAGTPYAGILNSIAAGMTAQGQHVTVTDLAPLTADDPSAVGLSAMGLPLIFGGMISAVALSLLFAHRNVWWQVGGSVAFSLLAGFGLTALVQFGFGTFEDAYLATSLALTLGIASISLTALGLKALLGMPGLGLAAVLMLFVSNPISGIATGPQWLPAPWGEIGQWLPIGAAGTAVRSEAFFAGGGASQAYLVLGIWIAAGVALAALGSFRASRQATSA